MNKYKNTVVFFVFLAIFVGLAFVLFSMYSGKKEPTAQPVQIFSDDIVKYSGIFSDGLNNPDSITTYELDEFGSGIAQKQVFYIDINQDDIKDRITKTLYETGNSHSYYEYKIEIKDQNKYVNITPNNIKTVNGEKCDLQQIQFSFKPSLKINVMYRELGNTWNEPTMAYLKTFSLQNNKLVESAPKKMRSICDVKELF